MNRLSLLNPFPFSVEILKNILKLLKNPANLACFKWTFEDALKNKQISIAKFLLESHFPLSDKAVRLMVLTCDKELIYRAEKLNIDYPYHFIGFEIDPVLDCLEDPLNEFIIGKGLSPLHVSKHSEANNKYFFNMPDEDKHAIEIEYPINHGNIKLLEFIEKFRNKENKKEHVCSCINSEETLNALRWALSHDMVESFTLVVNKKSENLPTTIIEKLLSLLLDYGMTTLKKFLSRLVYINQLDCIKHILSCEGYSFRGISIIDIIPCVENCKSYHEEIIKWLITEYGICQLDFNHLCYRGYIGIINYLLNQRKYYLVGDFYEVVYKNIKKPRDLDVLHHFPHDVLKSMFDKYPTYLVTKYIIEKNINMIDVISIVKKYLLEISQKIKTCKSVDGQKKVCCDQEHKLILNNMFDLALFYWKQTGIYMDGLLPLIIINKKHEAFHEIISKHPQCWKVQYSYLLWQYPNAEIAIYARLNKLVLMKYPFDELNLNEIDFHTASVYVCLEIVPYNIKLKGEKTTVEFFKRHIDIMKNKNTYIYNGMILKRNIG